MDAFFASIEQRDDPSLKGKPVVVGGTGPRAVVAAASYESRVFGIRSAIPMRDARRRCSDLIIVRPRMNQYRDDSNAIFAIFREFTPLVEGLSLDEAFLDLTESRRLFGDAHTMGLAIKRRIRDRTGLVASVGIAPNKLVAKIASDLDKPDGLCVVALKDVRATLDPLPIRKLFGVGPATHTRLTKLGVQTFHDLRTTQPERLRPIFGQYVSRMQARASGIDDRPVEAVREDKSISSEETFDQDLFRKPDLLKKLDELADETAARLRRRRLQAGVVYLKIREADFTTHTRQKSFRPASDDTATIRSVAREIFASWWTEHPGESLRLLGVGVASLARSEQLTLFENGANTALDDTVDAIRDRWGSAALRRGRGVGTD